MPYGIFFFPAPDGLCDRLHKVHADAAAATDDLRPARLLPLPDFPGVPRRIERLVDLEPDPRRVPGPALRLLLVDGPARAIAGIPEIRVAA